MEEKIITWEETTFNEYLDHLAIQFKIPPNFGTIRYDISAKAYWTKNQQDIYIIDQIFINQPSVLSYTFQNGIIIKGTLEIKAFSDFNSSDKLGVFVDIYYYENERRNYIWHTEGFVISF